MKALNEKYTHTAPDAWGQDSTTQRQHFEIEASDVGVERADFGGMGHSRHRFVKGDVGRKIEVITSPGYHSWHWLTLG